MLTNKQFMSKASRFFLIALIYTCFSLTTFSTHAQEESSSTDSASAATESSADGGSEDGIPSDDSMVSAGASLFKANCTQCHAINEQVVGPALKDVHKKRDIDWLMSWIKNSQRLIQSGDPTAVALYEEFNNTVMPSYPFSDEQVMSLLAYVKSESNQAPAPSAASDVPMAGGQTAAQGGDTVSSAYLTAILVVLIIVLILILVVLWLIVSVLTKYLKDQKELDADDAEIVHSKVDIKKTLQSDIVVGAVIFIFVALVLKTLIDGAFTIGVQQGYMPTQPIAFEHSHHVGQYEIDCNYCHTGVRKGKSANIPSPNICMNCHSAIKTESPEIQKIYAALDYDPKTGEYGDDTRPIEWIRVHNLPDLAYFNHSQHVEVGGIECQTCHGPIEEMDVVYQYSDLTMGWCINCHRETNVNTKGNDYYDNLVELHQEHSKEPLKVQDIGGIECAKCHY